MSWKPGTPEGGRSVFRCSVEGIKLGPSTASRLKIDNAFKNPHLVDIVCLAKDSFAIVVKDGPNGATPSWTMIDKETKEDLRQRINALPIVRHSFLSIGNHQ